MTGVGGSGHDPRPEYFHRDGEQEELQNGIVSGETEMCGAAFQNHNTWTRMKHQALPMLTETGMYK